MSASLTSQAAGCSTRRIPPRPASASSRYWRCGGRSSIPRTRAGGKLGRAVRWVTSEETQQRRERILDLLERLEGADPLDRLDAAEEFSKDKDDLPELLEIALYWYWDILVWQQTGEDDRLINLDRRDRIVALAPTLSPALLNARIQAVEDAGDALERNVHPRLLLETLFLRIAPPPAPTRR